jgi:hypothetical protein
MQDGPGSAQVSIDRPRAGFGILLVAAVYIAFALATQWEDYGLDYGPSARSEANVRWVLIRLSTASVWLLAAALLLWYSRRPVDWRSFSSSFIAAGIVAIVLASSIASGAPNRWAVAGSIVFYALVSGFLCVTIRKPAVAAGLGALFFMAQCFVDAAAHVFVGGFRLH